MAPRAWRVASGALVVAAGALVVGAFLYWRSLGPASGLEGIIPLGMGMAALALLLLAWAAASMPASGPAPAVVMGAYGGGVVGAAIALRAWTPAFFEPSPWIGPVMLLAAPLFAIFGGQVPALLGMAAGGVVAGLLWRRSRPRP